MTYQSYLVNCEKMLIDFELTQSIMLGLDLNRASIDFVYQMNKMRQIFNDIVKDFEKYNFNSDKDKLLLTKQVKRLLVFLKEMDLHISGFQTQSSPDEDEVIFVFDRQHLFKNIYRKHLIDFKTIIK